MDILLEICILPGGRSTASSGGALYIKFENHVRSWPLLKNSMIYERLYV